MKTRKPYKLTALVHAKKGDNTLTTLEYQIDEESLNEAMVALMSHLVDVEGVAAVHEIKYAGRAS